MIYFRSSLVSHHLFLINCIIQVDEEHITEYAAYDHADESPETVLNEFDIFCSAVGEPVFPGLCVLFIHNIILFTNKFLAWFI